MNETKFATVAREWLGNRRNFIKESTYALYMEQLEAHIIPTFGDYNCCDITEQIIQESVLGWLKNGRIDKKGGLSHKTVRDIVVILKLCINYGIKKGYINNQSFEVLFPPSQESPCIEVYTEKERKEITKAVIMDLNGKTFGILLSLYTGIRIGELCALQWSDVDFGNGIIHISKTLQRVYIRNGQEKGYTKILVNTPKSKSAIRDIPIHSEIKCILKKLDSSIENTYVLTGEKVFIEPRTYRQYYISFLKKNNLRVLKFHCLRHTFATSCIESGADYKTVSELLGHSSVNITLNRYVHPTIEQKRKCVELLDVYKENVII